MGRYRFTVVAAVAVSVIALAVIAACTQPFSGSGSNLEPANIGVPLPADQINDVARATAREFTFETVFPVSLRLQVDLFDVDETGRVVGQVPGETADVFVTLADGEGNPIYAGKAGADGSLAGLVQLPAAPEDVTMTLRASGFGDRTVIVPNMVELAAVDRVMAMARVVSGDGTYLARDLTGLEDSDGDGVPDAYDAFPGDPGSAFKLSVPAEGKLTIAFEDLFRRANAGDADYNDFVAAYAITEALTTEGYVDSITVNADAVDKIAGYNHRFGIRIDDFIGSATLTGTYIDAEGNPQPLGGTIFAPAEIILFENSSKAVPLSATFTLEFANPQRRPGTAPPAPVASEDELPPESPLPQAPYNPFAIVISTTRDIHLIGREPLANSTNKFDEDGNPETFRDADGFPWALLVPDDWDHPAEAQRIEIPYPRFTLWRESGGERHSDWYLHDDLPPPAQPVVYVAGYYNEGIQDVAASWVRDQDTGEILTTVLSEDARVADAVLHDGELYSAGFYRNGAGLEVAAYWRGGELVPVSMSSTESARAAAIHVAEDGTVYLAGYYTQATERRAVYWTVDGTEILMTSLRPDARSEATDIDLDADGNAYVSGYYNNGSNNVAVYWVNTQADMYELYPDGLSQAQAIDEDGGTVYVAGLFRDTESVKGAYWAGAGAPVVLTSSSPAVWDIQVVDGDVYVAGSFRNTDGRTSAAYWVNDAGGQVTLYSDDVNDARAYGILVEENDVFVAGSITDKAAGEPESVVYWKNGGAVALYPGQRSVGYAVAVSE